MAAEWLRQVAGGLVVGVMGVSLALAVAALVFRGALAGDYATGAAWAMAGLVAVGLVTALGSSIRGLAAGPQDAPSVVVAAAAAGIAAQSADPVPTVAAFVVVATTVTAVVLVVLGRRRLGAMVRFLPFPVVAGFLGGTGVVIVVAGTDLLVPGWTTADAGLRLVPGVLLAAALVWTSRRPTPAVLPAGLLLVGVVGYHVAAAALGIGRAEAVARGLVLGPFPPGRLLDVGVVTRLGDADWSLVLTHVPAMLVLALLATVGLLVNTGALEHAFGQDAEVDRELVVTGLGLLVAAPFAGMPGYVYVGNTVLGRRVGGVSRVPPLLGVALAGGVLLGAADLLSAVPVLVPGGLLLAIGIDFVLTWVWDVRRQVRPAELAVIVAIVVVVATLGFLEGVALGVVAAVVLFVVRYSRISAVRRAGTLATRRSHVQRAPEATAVLDERGRRVVIVELQGFVFFGSVEQALTTITGHLEDAGEVDALVLDLHHVTGLDSSANAGFRRLARMAEHHGFEVLLSDGTSDVLASLADDLRGDRFTLVRDLDRALELREERLLDSAGAGASGDAGEPDIGSDPFLSAPATRFPAGSVVLAAGRRDSGLYLLEAGRLAVIHGTWDPERAAADATHPDRVVVPAARHAVLLPGTVLGELSLLSGQPANATVVCETDSVLRHISSEEVADLVVNHPRQALELHQFIARRLAGKLDAADRTIGSLQ